MKLLQRTAEVITVIREVVKFKFKFKFNEISSEAGQMASIPGYTIVSRNTFQYTMI